MGTLLDEALLGFDSVATGWSIPYRGTDTFLA